MKLLSSVVAATAALLLSSAPTISAQATTAPFSPAGAAINFKAVVLFGDSYTDIGTRQYRPRPDTGAGDVPVSSNIQAPTLCPFSIYSD